MTADSFARRQAWVRNSQRIGERWRAYTGLIVVGFGAVALFALFPALPLHLLLSGVMAGAVLTLVMISASGMDDPVMLGYQAEQWTAELFTKQKWSATSNLVFTDGDVDHVIVAPCGVLAVETKYRFRQSDKRRLMMQRTRDLEATQRAARKTNSLLRSKDFCSSATIIPVLIIWGPGRPSLPDGHRVVDGVHILDGNRPQLWSHLFAAPMLDGRQRDDLANGLTRFQRRQNAYTETKVEPLRRTCWAEFRTSMADSNRLRAHTREQSRALRARHAGVAAKSAG